jgi:glycosyltransferase involved in cell wall biosynthesis
MIRKNILLLAYSVSPIRGSEYSVGWNYIKEMSQDHNLIVLLGSAGEHMGDLNEVTLSPVCQNLPNVQWVPVRPDGFTNLLNSFNRKGIFIYTFYLAYRYWQKQAYQQALQLVQDHPIDLVHYIGPIGFREPGYLWKIEKPFIWGPIGGANNRSARLAFDKSVITGLKITLRNFVNTLQFKFSPRVRKALKRADLLISSTSRVRDRIKNVHGINSIIMPENAITDDMFARQRLVDVKLNSTINLIWVGRIDENKSLDILIKALEPIKGGKWSLSVIGDGPLKPQCVELARNLSLDGQIVWAGKLTREQVNDYYQKSHVHVITSMLEGNPTVIWEAMSFGLPSITLDHFGMHDTVCEKCGIKVPVDGSLQTIVKELTKAIREMIEAPQIIEQLSKGVQECAVQYAWAKRRFDWSRHYDTAINNWKLRQ